MLEVGKQTLTIIRGLPGSGKSALAKKIANEGCAVHYEADMYFEKDGEYKFNPALVPIAHSWCRKMVAKALYEGKSVVVSNTFTETWEILPYVEMVSRMDLNFQILCLKSSYGSIHNVPASSIKKMVDRWEDIPGEHIILSSE